LFAQYLLAHDEHVAAGAPSFRGSSQDTPETGNRRARAAIGCPGRGPQDGDLLLVEARSRILELSAAGAGTASCSLKRIWRAAPCAIRSLRSKSPSSFRRQPFSAVAGLASSRPFSKGYCRFRAYLGWTPFFVDLPGTAVPTVTHQRGPVHETPHNPLARTPNAGGTRCSRHRNPFHRSASSTVRPLRRRIQPTTTQKVSGRPPPARRGFPRSVSLRDRDHDRRYARAARDGRRPDRSLGCGATPPRRHDHDRRAGHRPSIARHRTDR
jgi:hypothetical protein